jgi:hypothetical protein
VTAPLKPSLAWFDYPEPDHAEPLTIEANGLVHGHLAPWEGCHAGLINGTARSCVKPPPSLTDYRMFHLGQLETAEGEMLPVGKIIVAGDHATTAPGTTLQAATAHYDKTGSVGAFVRARNGKHGIWLSGATKSDITPEQLRDLRANLPSGDWRNWDHNLELIGALAVPVPGYGIPAIVASGESGEIEALILQGFSDTEDEMETTRDRSFQRRRDLIAGAIELRPEEDYEALIAATFTAKQRERLAGTGAAMPDGSFPIRNCSDWENARRAIGRANPSRRAAVQAHINKRGRALGCGDEGD